MLTTLFFALNLALASSPPRRRCPHPRIVKRYVAEEWRAPTATDSRSPCPGINALANHGILPRDGRNITHPMLVDIFEKFLNFEETFAIAVANASNFFLRADGTFDLHDTALHGVIEDNASFVHDDILPGEKFVPVETNMTKTELLLGLSADGVLMTAKDLAVARYLMERALTTPLDPVHQDGQNLVGPLGLSAFGFTQQDGTKAMKVEDFRNATGFPMASRQARSRLRAMISTARSRTRSWSRARRH